jgi:hypothetical protein
MSDQYNYDESIYNPSGNVATNKVEISERTLSILALVFSVAALVTAIIYGSWAKNEAEKAARETRVLQQIVMDQTAIMVREGLKQPGDIINGPNGNLDYKPRSK